MKLLVLNLDIYQVSFFCLFCRTEDLSNAVSVILHPKVRARCAKHCSQLHWSACIRLGKHWRALVVFRVVNESFLWNCLFTRTTYTFFTYVFTEFTCMHLADAFIQTVHSIQCIQAICFLSVGYMCSLGIEPTTFALLTQCSTTEPQGHGNSLPFQHVTALEYIFNMTLWTMGPSSRMWKSRIIFMNEINTNILLLERTRWMDQSDHSPDLLNVI